MPAGWPCGAARFHDWDEAPDSACFFTETADDDDLVSDDDEQAGTGATSPEDDDHHDARDAHGDHRDSGAPLAASAGTGGGRQEPNGARPAASASGKPTRSEHRRRQQRKWICSDAQKNFIKRRRTAFDADPRADPRADSQRGWRIDPGVARGGALGRTLAPSPADFQLHPWGAWVPDRLWPSRLRAPPCPRCGRADMVNSATACSRRGGPRKVFGGPAGFWFLDTKQYQCDFSKSGGKKCGKFYATHPDSVRRLPEEIRIRFQVLLGSRSAVTGDLAQRIFLLWKEPIPTAHIARILNHEAETRFLDAQCNYWAWCASYTRPGVEAPPAAAGSLDPHILLMPNLFSEDASIRGLGHRPAERIRPQDQQRARCSSFYAYHVPEARLSSSH